MMDLMGFKSVAILNDFCVCCHYFSPGTLLTVVSVPFVCSGRTEVQSVQYGKEKGIKDRVFAR